MRIGFISSIAVLCAVCILAEGSWCTASDTAQSFLPPENVNLNLAAPINTWDEAIPLGNGRIGGLLWGKDQTIRLSLDRGDLWDLREPDEFKKDDFTWKTLRQLVEEKNQTELANRFEKPYFAPWPTKLPGGRLEISFDRSWRATSFTLDLAHAVGHVGLGKNARLETFFCADAPVAWIRISGPRPKQWRLIAPDVVKQLKYPEADLHQDGDTKWFVQNTVTGFRYVVMASACQQGDATLLAVTIATTNDGVDPVAVGRKRLAEAFQSDCANMLARHEAWWREYWGKSRVDLPEPEHLRHYYLAQYLLGAASRLGTPPMTLQGLWTADDGRLPPWKGEYANNTNTQMCYAAYQTAGHFDEGRCLLDFLWNLLPQFRTFAKNFFDAEGAAIPTAMALDGKPLGGWATVAVHPTNAAWIAHLFYQHWKYTADKSFLRQRAYPFCAEIGHCLLCLLHPDADGKLVLPLSASPEIHDNNPNAWLHPNSNYDHDCMAALFAALAEMADALGKKDEARKWQAALAGLGTQAVDPKSDCLMLAPSENLAESHRHFSHTMSIFPFGMLTTDGSDRDRSIIAASYRHYEELGTRGWVGFSFPWMACLRARVGDADAAIRYLDIYRKAFILRNGFHANGDQLKAGYSDFTYRPFTLEGNMLASQAVHEMLLQSWNNVIRVFPATPARWSHAAFDDLRAEGGYRVSARRENGVTTWLKVVAGRDGVVKIRDNFDDQMPVWSRPNMNKVGKDWQCLLKSGETVEACWPPPEKPLSPQRNRDMACVIESMKPSVSVPPFAWHCGCHPLPYP